MIIYRVIAKHGPFVSKWVTTLTEAKKIKKNVENNIIFGGDDYIIEKSELKI